MSRRRPWLLTLFFLGGIFVILIFAVTLLVVWMQDGAMFKGGEQVALIRLEGMITDADPIVDSLERYGRDPKVRAIVLRIDTPGGAVSPTQEAFRAVRKWNKTKKIVASMGSMATSGGYYVACGSERLVANPGTITGSIGVVVHFANLEKLLEKLGVQGDVIKSGAHKDMGSPHRALSPQEREILQGVIDDVHDQFVEDVAQARNLPKDLIHSLADGRIFSGRQAQELSLVDELGGLRDAIRIAARLGGIEGEPQVVEAPRKKFSLIDLLFGRFLGRFMSSGDPRNPFIGYVFHL